MNRRKNSTDRPHRKAKPRRGSEPTVVVGETAPDERNANVQQSQVTAEGSEGDPWGDQQLTGTKPPAGEFAPEEIGDADETEPEPGNPQAVQGGRGPLDQEAEGNRQNDEFAELE